MIISVPTISWMIRTVESTFPSKRCQVLTLSFPRGEGFSHHRAPAICTVRRAMPFFSEQSCFASWRVLLLTEKTDTPPDLPIGPNDTPGEWAPPAGRYWPCWLAIIAVFFGGSATLCCIGQGDESIINRLISIHRVIVDHEGVEQEMHGIVLAGNLNRQSGHPGRGK